MQENEKGTESQQVKAEANLFRQAEASIVGDEFLYQPLAHRLSATFHSLMTSITLR